MTFEKTYKIQKDNRLVIELPERFKSIKKVRVIIEDIEDSRAEKLKSLKKAAVDPLFLADIEDVASDFENADSEV